MRDDPHRFKVLVAGRKARKTTFIINRLAYCALTDKRGLTYVYIAPYRSQAKDIVWNDHLGRLRNLFTQFGIQYKVNESELTISFDNASRIKVTGADNAEALRGKSDWGGVGMDEVRDIRPYIWEEIVRPNLTTNKAWCIFGSTPAVNHFYKLAKLGDWSQTIDNNPSQLDRDFITFHATSYDNIYIDKEEIDSAKRQTSMEYFNQEYMALFVRLTGLVYPEFNTTIHVEEFEHVPNQYGDYYFGQDFAVRGYTAMVVGCMRSDGILYILDEYKVEGDTAKNHSQAEKEILKKYTDLNKYTGYGDPAGFAKTQQQDNKLWSLADEYMEDGMPLTMANNDVTSGINYVRQLFRNDKIRIHPRCQLLIEELRQYQWKEQSEKKKGMETEPEKVRKIHDHLVDALRYMCYSKPTKPEEQESPRDKVFPGSFPPPRIEKPDPEADQYEEIRIDSIYD